MTKITSAPLRNPNGLLTSPHDPDNLIMQEIHKKIKDQEWFKGWAPGPVFKYDGSIRLTLVKKYDFTHLKEGIDPVDHIAKFLIKLGNEVTILIPYDFAFDENTNGLHLRYYSYTNKGTTP